MHDYCEKVLKTALYQQHHAWQYVVIDQEQLYQNEIPDIRHDMQNMTSLYMTMQQCQRQPAAYLQIPIFDNADWGLLVAIYENDKWQCNGFNLTVNMQEGVNSALMRLQEPLATHSLQMKIPKDDDITSSQAIIKVMQATALAGQMLNQQDLEQLPTDYNGNYMGLILQKISGDGHCFFNAVSLYTGEDQATLRQRVAQYLQEHRDQYNDFYQGDEGSFDRYISAIERGEEWGDQISMTAVQHLYGRPVVVMRPQGQTAIVGDLQQFSGEPIFVYYNGHDHYDALLLNEGQDAQQILNTIQAAQNLRSTHRVSHPIALALTMGFMHTHYQFNA